MSQSEDNERVRAAWNQNADFWDAQSSAGNEFFETLVWPAVERQLELQSGERVLDIACGTGLTSRRMAKAGAQVVAFDFSEAMIAAARKRTLDDESDRTGGPSSGPLAQPNGSVVDFHILDATDETALVALGERFFDAALCNLAIMDMTEVRPLFRALRRLLRPGGRFVLSILHPCFNNPAALRVAEHDDRDGTFVTTYGVQVARYMSPFVRRGRAMPGQPVPHPYFHRSLSDLLAPALDSGFVLDALEERSYPACTVAGSTPLSWSGNFSEIPPVMICRLRTAGLRGPFSMGRLPIG